MKKLLLSLSVAVALWGAPALADQSEQKAESPAVGEEKLQTYRDAAKDFLGALKGELQAAMKSGGPVKAIEVCHTKAPKIAEEKSEAHGFELARTSLKPRNPENAPDEWETRVMKSFEEQKAEGADPMKLEHAEVVETEDGAKKIRYMKAIPTAEICLACHGDELSGDVEAKLKALYPEDQAIGFKAGDLRGAFSFSEKIVEDDS